MKKTIYTLISGLTMTASFLLDARTVELKTGHWPIDSIRTIDIDNFEYIYELQYVPLAGRFIELEDGSVWKIEPLGPESTSFYKEYKDVLEVGFIEELVDLWQPGERLIFHKITDREIHESDEFLVYNLDRDLLVDVTILSPPIYYCLTLSEVDEDNQLIVLSDSSIWHYDNWDKASDHWFCGDPILVAKDNPWRSDHTHVLVNLQYCNCSTTLGHIHRNRVSVTQGQ